jgi:ABC-type transporter Mla MlaB component
MKNQSISIKVLTDSVTNIRLLLEGQLIIKNAEYIKMELTAALHHSQNIELVFKNVLRIDVAILQLIIALQKTAAKLKKNVTLDIEVTESIQAAIRNAGLEKLLTPNFKMQPNGI